MILVRVQAGEKEHREEQEGTESMSDRDKRDELGVRMKGQYEDRAQSRLPRRTYTVIRLDGKAFHTYTRGLDKPYDRDLMADMTETTRYLCQQIEGVKLGYTQSDEISLILTDFATMQTGAWFNGNVQKMVSVSASLATAKFNELRPGKLATFDSRVFTIPDVVEVVNYLVWRQADATRNSIQAAGQAKFSQRRLHGLSGGQIQDLLWAEHDINWNDYTPRFKRGTVVVPEVVVGPVTYVDKRDGEEKTIEEAQRTYWTDHAAPIFTRDTEILGTYLPGWAARRVG